MACYRSPGSMTCDHGSSRAYASMENAYGVATAFVLVGAATGYVLEAFLMGFIVYNFILYNNIMISRRL